ncbi:MAG: hypothetical protein IIB43_03665, partial [Candidatus Marinimicrobia bacterium]|nr:hypothetical protein [Candidatus Neomarinimicrobiota bacterium]
MHRSTQRIFLIVAIIVAALILAVIMAGMKPEPPKKEREEIDVLVDVLVLETMTASFSIRSQGTVQPRTQTILSAEVAGTVT